MGFLIGLIIGLLAGVTLTAIVSVNNRGDK